MRKKVVSSVNKPLMYELVKTGQNKIEKLDETAYKKMERSIDDKVKVLEEKLEEVENQRKEYQALSTIYETRLNRNHRAYEDARYRAARREADLANENLRLRNSK